MKAASALWSRKERKQDTVGRGRSGQPEGWSAGFDLRLWISSISRLPGWRFCLSADPSFEWGCRLAPRPVRPWAGGVAGTVRFLESWACSLEAFFPYPSSDLRGRRLSCSTLPVWLSGCPALAHVPDSWDLRGRLLMSTFQCFRPLGACPSLAPAGRERLSSIDRVQEPPNRHLEVI